MLRRREEEGEGGRERGVEEDKGGEGGEERECMDVELT